MIGKQAGSHFLCERPFAARPVKHGLSFRNLLLLYKRQYCKLLHPLPLRQREGGIITHIHLGADAAEKFTR